MIKKHHLLFLIFLFSQGVLFSQENDTVVVYEEEIIHDTIYVDDETNPIIPVNQRKAIPAKTRKVTNWEFGTQILMGIHDSNFYQSINEKKQYGFGAGFWVEKPFAEDQLSVSFGVDYQFWNKTFELNATTEDTPLNGYYFTDDNEPILFQKLNNQYSEISIPLKMNFNFMKFSIYAGIYGNFNTLKMGFLIPENGILQKYSDFTSSNMNFGYVSGLRYRLRKLRIFAEYRRNEQNNLRFKNPEIGDLIFEFENSFIDQKVLLGIGYQF